MSSNSIVNTSVERAISSRVMNNGGGCFCEFHHFTAGAKACNEANELSRITQNRFTFENSGWKSPATADPNRITLSRFAPAAVRSRPIKSLIRFSGIIYVLATSCCYLRRHRPRRTPPPPQPRHHRRQNHLHNHGRRRQTFQKTESRTKRPARV